MMLKEITIHDALDLPQVLFVDVRSPAEFKEATIPGAINVPLLDDEERKIVGTVYKQESPVKAKKIGMDLIAPKLPQITEEMSKLAQEHQLVVLCWRGGMRSLTVSLIMGLMGLPVFRLSGGYKAYRNYINSFFNQDRLPQQVILLQGLTGVGKTEILVLLEQEGLPVLDLEAFACNRGSVFGWVGQVEPPSQKMFESLLVNKLKSFGKFKHFFVECESRKVGKLILPPLLMKEMDAGKKILLYDTVENRVERLVRDYTSNLNPETLLPSIRLLTPRLGKEKIKYLEELVVAENFSKVAEILLTDYYDPLYNYHDQPDNSYDLCVNTGDPTKAVAELKEFLLLLESK